MNELFNHLYTNGLNTEEGLLNSGLGSNLKQKLKPTLILKMKHL